METCIDEYFADTTVERNCDKCNYGRSVRKTFMCKCPDIIIFCLKRFQFNGTKFLKQTTPITVSKTLNMQKFTKFNKSKTVYKLKSIALHHGNVDDGHYTALICSGDDFINVDDIKCETVSSSEANEFITSKTYMIFYERT
jgi:ubiquitin carboxyl-terminal hydrolase 8